MLQLIIAWSVLHELLQTWTTNQAIIWNMLYIILLFDCSLGLRKTMRGWQLEMGTGFMIKFRSYSDCCLRIKNVYDLVFGYVYDLRLISSSFFLFSWYTFKKILSGLFSYFHSLRWFQVCVKCCFGELSIKLYQFIDTAQRPNFF